MNLTLAARSRRSTFSLSVVVVLERKRAKPADRIEREFTAFRRSMIHVGLIGAGNISDTHARAVSEISGATVAAVHAPTRAHAERLAARHGAAAYDALDRFLDHRPLDMVIVGSPVGASCRSRYRGGRTWAPRAGREAD